MYYLSVDFVCRFQGKAHLPCYKGSLLRGALGNALRHAVCMRNSTQCLECLLGSTCIFPRLFTFASAPADSFTAPRLPPPFCIEPPLDDLREYADGDIFTFRVKLFSYAVEYLPYFVHSFKLAGERGMGQGAADGQGRFSLEDVLLDGRSIYDTAKERLLPWQPKELPLPTLLSTARQETHLRLTLLTPLRFKQANRLAIGLDFTQLVLLLLRRLASLTALDGRTFRLPQGDFHALMHSAASMRLVKSDLRWHDWRRYSGRQHVAMQLGGLLGHVDYTGPTAAFAAYLDFAAAVHLGKQTSFGLGAMQATWNDL